MSVPEEQPPSGIHSKHTTTTTTLTQTTPQHKHSGGCVVGLRLGLRPISKTTHPQTRKPGCTHALCGGCLGMCDATATLVLVAHSKHSGSPRVHKAMHTPAWQANTKRIMPTSLRPICYTTSRPKASAPNLVECHTHPHQERGRGGGGVSTPQLQRAAKSHSLRTSQHCARVPEGGTSQHWPPTASSRLGATSLRCQAAPQQPASRCPDAGSGEVAPDERCSRLGAAACAVAGAAAAAAVGAAAGAAAT